MSKTVPSNARILIIDDEAIIRESISTYLEDSGFSVDQSSDGLEGLALFRAEKPDVVLLDLRMPKMDGLEVLATMMAESATTPVIVITGAGVLQDAVAAYCSDVKARAFPSDEHAFAISDEEFSQIEKALSK